jgi:hypothetical protein
MIESDPIGEKRRFSMKIKVIPLDFYQPGEPVISGEGRPPKKGDVLGQHRVKGVVQNYYGRTVVVLEPLPK